MSLNDWKIKSIPMFYLLLNFNYLKCKKWLKITIT